MVSDKASYCIVFGLSLDDTYLVEKELVSEFYRKNELPRNAKIIDVDMTPETAKILTALAGTYKNADELAQKLTVVCDLVKEIESKKDTAQSLKSYLDEHSTEEV